MAAKIGYKMFRIGINKKIKMKDGDIHTRAAVSGKF